MTPTLEVKQQETAENLKLQLRRVIRASRERVFAAWTQPEKIEQWFGRGNMTRPEVQNDLRVGGAYRIEMKGPDASCADPSKEADRSCGSVASGVYRKIVPNELLCFTWKGDWLAGEETLVTVELRGVEGGTEVTLTHERFPTVESMGKHEQGWTACLEKLDHFLCR